MIPEISEKQFHQQLAEAISDLIAKRLNIYPKQALNLFEKSRVYKDLMNSDDEFDQMMPADFFDLWQNERLVGVPVSSADIANGILKDKKYK